jgi:hypothetical protein
LTGPEPVFSVRWFSRANAIGDAHASFVYFCLETSSKNSGTVSFLILKTRHAYVGCNALPDETSHALEKTGQPDGRAVADRQISFFPITRQRQCPEMNIVPERI